MRAGAWPHVAAQFCGVTLDTFLNWVDEEKCPGEPYESFRREIEQAEAGGAIEALQVIMKEMHRNWFAAAWFLERRHGYVANQSAADTAPRRLIVSDTDDPSRDAAQLAADSTSLISSLSAGPDGGAPLGETDGQDVVRESEDG